MVIEGDEVVIRCPVDAVPLPDITWLKVGNVFDHYLKCPLHWSQSPSIFEDRGNCTNVG